MRDWGRIGGLASVANQAGSTTRRELGQVQLDVLRSDLRPSDASGVPAAVVLTVLGDLDMAAAPGFRQAVVAEVAGGARLVVLDLTAVDFVDSVGLGVVVGALRRLRAHAGDLVVVCPEPRIRRVFEMCDLDRVFALHQDVGAAAAAMAGRAPA